MWNDYPQEETSGVCRQFVCKYHGWRYDLDGSNTFVQQESEFFDFDKDDFGLVPVHCDVWAGFIFVNVTKGEPEQNLRDFLGPMVTKLENYPFEKLTERYFYRATEYDATGSSTWTPFPEFYHAPILHAEADAARPVDLHAAGRFRGAGLCHRRAAPPGEHSQRPSLDPAREHAQADGARRRAAVSSAPGTSPTSTSTRKMPASTRPAATPGVWTRSRSGPTS